VFIIDIGRSLRFYGIFIESPFGHPGTTLGTSCENTRNILGSETIKKFLTVRKQPIARAGFRRGQRRIKR